MNPTDDVTKQRQKVARYAWLVTVAITVLFVIAPFSYTASLSSNSNDQFDPTVNIIELVGIAGCMSALAFSILALTFRAGGKVTQKRTPSAMRRSLDQGIVLTFFYWLLFIALTSTGSDGDGIMRGWMVIFYPFVVVSYVLLSSRETRDR
jgi:hypothetical protein